MKTIHIFKAQPVGTHEEIAPVQISIIEELRSWSTLEESRMQFEQQGRVLANTLCNVLPGGTIDALLVELLKRKVSLLVVPHAPTNTE